MSDGTDEIKRRLSIVEVVGTHVELHKAGRNFKAKCPFHKERTPSFMVSPERGTYYCFGCGEKGDIFSFVEKIEGLDFKGALTVLAERAGVTLAQYRSSPERAQKKERLYELVARASQLFEEGLSHSAEALEYLLSRGLLETTVRAWNIGYAPPAWRALTETLRTEGYTDGEIIEAGLAVRPEDKGKEPYDRFRGRIMFPIKDSAGRVVGFSGRIFKEMPGSERESAKYVNSPETALYRKSSVLHGLDKAKQHIRTSSFALLVEGQMDLLMSHQSGFPNTVALSGTALTREQVRSLGHLSKRLVLALDADAAGLRSTIRSAELALSEGFEVKVARLPEGKDPADVAREGKDALRTCIREAESVVAFLLTATRKETKDERSWRRRAGEVVLPLIATMKTAIDRAHFAQEAARILGISEVSVEEDIRAIRERAPRREAEESLAPEAKEESQGARIPHLLSLLYALAGGAGDDPLMLRAKEILKDSFPEAMARADPLRERALFVVEEHEDRKTFAGEVLLELEREALEGSLASARERHARALKEGNAEEIRESLADIQALARERELLRRKNL